MVESSLRLLVVEDMNSMRKVVVRTCKELGFVNVSEAADGQVAWGIVESAQPGIDVVVSDWNMPVMTGLDLLRNMRSDPRFKNTLFVMLTAEGEGHQKEEAKALGVDCYVQKPIAPSDLKAKLQEVLRSRSMWKDAA